MAISQDRNEWIGLIPAAGKGLRLGLPYPKELYPVIRNNRYKPVAQFILENMTAADLKHVVFVINETKNQLMGYFGSGSRFHCNISYVVQESFNGAEASTSPGLAHALDSAYHLTRGHTVHFGMADTIIQPLDFLVQARALAQPDDDLVLCVFPTQYPEKGGMTRWDAQHRVSAIVDKPKHTDLTHTWGSIIWGPGFTELLHQSLQSGITDFAAILNQAVEQGMHVRAAEAAGASYMDMGTYEEILELDQRLRDSGAP